MVTPDLNACASKGKRQVTIFLAGVHRPCDVDLLTTRTKGRLTLLSTYYDVVSTKKESEFGVKMILAAAELTKRGNKN